MSEISTTLLPCPFCDGDAEMDTMQAYRGMSTGALGHAVAIYCTKCSVQMTHCYEDHRGTDREDLQADLAGAWNLRSDPGRAALVAVSDCLASAFQIVQREGIHDTPGTTSWNLAADRFSKIFHEHHAAIIEARKDAESHG